MSYDANSAYPTGPGAPGSGYGAPGPGVPGFGAAPQGAASPEDLSLPLYGASFGQAVKRFFKKYTVFTGRASRSEYWWVALFCALVQLIPFLLMMIGGIVMVTSVNGDPYATPSGGGVALMTIGGILMGLFFLAIIVPSLAVSWRRLHDANFSGLFYLLTLTSIGSIVVLVMTLLPPKAEGQRFDV